MATQNPSFAVVVPMYNEEVGAETCVRVICEALARIPSRTSLIVVEDGSRDATRSLLTELAGAYSLLDLVIHPMNRGYGAALRSGTERASERGFDYVLFMDSDLTNDPEDIPKFYERMREGIDVIKACRFSHGGGMRGVPFRRRLVSHVGNWIARTLFNLPLKDCTNGFRAVRTNLLVRLPLRANDFSIIMEELFYLKGTARTFGGVPVVLTSRTDAQRPTSFQYRPSVFVQYLKYPLKSLVSVPVSRGA
jgi:dolichol-phosphate mannosyltransferase